MPAGMRCASSTIRCCAEPHFRELHILATLPRTQARASYWLGRTHEAEGETAAARLAYVEAARFGGTFYGQLAREKLGITTTGLERMPRPSALDRLRFADRDLVKAIRLLAAAGHADRSLPFLRRSARPSTRPARSRCSRRWRGGSASPAAGIAAAAAAEQRGLKVASLPAPFYRRAQRASHARTPSTGRWSTPSCARKAPSTTRRPAMPARAG